MVRAYLQRQGAGSAGLTAFVDNASLTLDGSLPVELQGFEVE